MKLFYAPASPFARKVLACAVARDIDSRIEPVEVNASQSPPALLAVNPLSKIPALLTDDGQPLYDSPVICEYLDSLGDAAPMFPPSGGARWRALLHQGQGDGMMDAAVLRRGESLRPVEAARTAAMDRQKAAIDRTLVVLEREPPHQALDIGTIAIGCALGYLDFRFAAEPWRPAHPRLAEWYRVLAAQPPFTRTEPRELA